MKLLIVLLVLMGYLQDKCHGLYIPRSTENQVLDIIVPKTILRDFEYVPTKEGYRYSYQLIDGTRREEIGFITNPGELNQGVLAMGAMTQSGRDSTRPMMKAKSRKLSPKALQGLAG